MILDCGQNRKEEMLGYKEMVAMAPLGWSQQDGVADWFALAHKVKWGKNEVTGEPAAGPRGGVLIVLISKLPAENFSQFSQQSEAESVVSSSLGDWCSSEEGEDDGYVSEEL